MITWKELATRVEGEYVVYVDWDERFFTCPECQKPIYEEDFSMIEGYFCPICEEPLD